MYSNEKHRENGIFDIILSVVFYIMIFCAPFVDVVVNGQIAETKTLAGFLKEHSDNTVSLILNIFPVLTLYHFQEPLLYIYHLPTLYVEAVLRSSKRNSFFHKMFFQPVSQSEKHCCCF